jgi:membrane associated rhomboid family serine protease
MVGEEAVETCSEEDGHLSEQVAQVADDVEERLGAVGYLVLIALSAITGDLLHALINLGSTIPTIGASGGISGIIAFYALRFPRRRLRRWAYGVWYDLRVSTAIGIWVAFLPRPPGRGGHRAAVLGARPLSLTISWSG